MQQKQTTNPQEFTDVLSIPRQGRVLALDPGMKRIGVAVCDETQSVTRALPRIERGSWKKLLIAVKDIVKDSDAVGLVIGLPLESDGSESKMSAEARRMARSFALSLSIPVVLQDERVTSYEAKGRLWAAGASIGAARDAVDSEAASIILNDFITDGRRSIR